MAQGYSVEHNINVYDEGTGDYIYIGPDGDRLDLLELRYVEASDKILIRLSLPKEQARLVAQAMLDLTEPNA